MQITGSYDNHALTIHLPPRLDVSSVPEAEHQMNDIRARYPEGEVIFDASHLSFITVAGLRLLIKFKRQNGHVIMINANDQVYDYLVRHSVPYLIPVEKQIRHVSVNGCDLIGQGTNGKVYRLTDRTIVKDYFRDVPLERIKNQIDVARRAYALGMPTPTVFDIVRTDTWYGIVYEFVDAKTVDGMIRENPTLAYDYAKGYVRLLKKAHGVHAPSAGLPEVKKRWLRKLENVRSLLSGEEYDLVVRALNSVPERDTFVHGDFHVGNVMYENGHYMMIDMDNVGIGHPVFDLSALFMSYLFIPTYQPDVTKQVFDMSAGEAMLLWHTLIEEYFHPEGDHDITWYTHMIAPWGMIRYLLALYRQTPEDTKKLLTIYREKLFPRLRAGAELPF